jgi:hypothetical protein
MRVADAGTPQSELRPPPKRDEKERRRLATIGAAADTKSRTRSRIASNLLRPFSQRLRPLAADLRLAPNPTSRRDHSDLLQFHFFNQNEIRIELIAERAACRIVEHSSPGHDALEQAWSAAQS